MGAEQPVGYCSPPVAHRFKPGVSGNPGGRRKGRSLTARLRDFMDAPSGEGQVADDVIGALVDAAKSGDMKAQQIIWDRLDGKVADVQADDSDQNPVSEAGAAAAIEAGLRATGATDDAGPDPEYPADDA